MVDAPGSEFPPFLKGLGTRDSTLQGMLAPGVYAYGSERPMGRIRAYSAAGLSPFAGRGAPREFHLLGHIHLDADNKVTRIEGFNGQEGERWAKQAKEKLDKTGDLAPGAVVTPAMPLRGCPHTGIR